MYLEIVHESVFAGGICNARVLRPIADQGNLRAGDIANCRCAGDEQPDEVVHCAIGDRRKHPQGNRAIRILQRSAPISPFISFDHLQFVDHRRSGHHPGHTGKEDGKHGDDILTAAIRWPQVCLGGLP